MAFYRRRLPHWHPPGKALFLTWRLYDSLPKGRAFSIGDSFATYDRLLDKMSTGPLLLRMPEIADIVAEEIASVNPSAWVIMPNHVHVLAEPVEGQDWVRRLKLIKGRSARKANLILSRTGQPFWQEETYDHWIRNATEFRQVARYIERNPVRAGLAASPADYRWSSAHVKL